MDDFTIAADNNAPTQDISVNTAKPDLTASQELAKGQQVDQKSIYGEVPQIPTLDAIEGIKFDFNDGIRILFPQNQKEGSRGCGIYPYLCYDSQCLSG